MSAIAVLPRGLEVGPDIAGSARASGDPQRYTVVRVEGELDAAVCADFRAALDKAVTSNCAAVVVDFRATRFLSIGAARTLALAKDEAEAMGVDLRVVACHREIERVLEVTGLRSLFRSYPTVAAAAEGVC